MRDAPFYFDVTNVRSPLLSHWRLTQDHLRLRCVCSDLTALSKKEIEKFKGTVLLFTGRTEYAEKYGHIFDEVLAKGYAFASVDWRGQGLSERLLKNEHIGHVVRFSDYQKDVQTLLQYAQDLELPRPYVLLGHSMGGAIGLRALYEGLDVRAAAFSAPMWNINIKPPILHALSRGILSALCLAGQGAQFAPTQNEIPYLQSAQFETNVLTYDRSMWENIKLQIQEHPELGLGGVSNLWMKEALGECSDLMNKDPLSIPVYTILGEDEAVVSPKAIIDRMTTWPQGVLDTFPHVRHETLLEGNEQRQRVIKLIFEYFDEHVATSV